MADISPQQALSKVLPRLGGVAGAAKLSERCIRAIITHPGDVVVIRDNDYVLRLPNVRGGYRVYDDRMQLRYAITYDTTQAELYETYGHDVRVPEFKFGYNKLDELWLASVEPGDFFYLGYTSVGRNQKDHKHIALVVKSPIERLEDIPVGVNRSNILRSY